MTAEARRAQSVASMRLFVALELPPAWREALARLQDDMRAALAAEPSTAAVRVRWVRPENIHLTLKFLGQVEVSRLPPIEMALGNAVSDPPRFSLRLGRAGSFSDRRAPRVLWVGIADERIDRSPLGRLAERVETWLASAGFPRERRSFSPHLTLARLPEDLGADQRQAVAAVTARLWPQAVEPFEVRAISLMRSYIGPGGARYECLGRFPPV